MVEKSVVGLKDRFRDGLEDKCQLGAQNVSFEFLSIPVRLLISCRPPMLRFKSLMSSLQACTGRASEPVSGIFTALYSFTEEISAIRRHGAFRRDLNVELSNPLTKSIASSWSKVFESDLFAEFEKATKAAIEKLIKEVENSAPTGLKDRTRGQGLVCQEEANVALKKTLDLVKETMNNEQKEVSRIIS